jgi:hypothetical protein
MPSTLISCTLEISGSLESDREYLVSRIRAELENSTTTLKDAAIKSVSPRDQTTMIAFEAMAAGRPATRHIAAIETLLGHALLAFRDRTKPPVSAAIANVHLERQPD